MKQYAVKITETLQMTVEIEANNRQEAEKIVCNQWRNSEYILDAECFKGVDFKACPLEREHDGR